MMKYFPDVPRTAIDVFHLLPEGTLCEVIDNALHMLPAVTSTHQFVLGDIFLEIKLLCRAKHIGKIYQRPLDVYLDDEQNVVTPDLIFVKVNNLSAIRKTGIYGVPDLVIEILSENVEYDKEKKFALYQRNQIPEYIIIEPDTKEVWHYILKDGGYK